MKFSNFTHIAMKAAKTGGDVLMKYYGKPLNIEYKGTANPVSQADKNAQKKIVSIIKEAFPIHSFLAEEEGLKDNAESDFCWIIDPLDGTINFIHNLPIFCVSIGLRHKKEMIAGVIYAPYLKELFVAEKGKGAYFNGRKMKPSKIEQEGGSLAVTGFPYGLKSDNERVFKNFRDFTLRSEAVRRIGSAALDMAYTACGRFDFFWEEGISAWDIAAGIIIAKEAGCAVSDYQGENNYFDNQSIVVSGNKTLHKQVLGIINE